MNKPLPQVSVVIPVYNETNQFKRCLHALSRQTLPCDQFEVILIDDTSPIPLAGVESEFPELQIRLIQNSKRSGSYFSRNQGILSAQSPILAFTDADCTPSPHWLEKGLHALEYENADLVGGEIRFDLTENKSAAALWDSLSYMQQEYLVNKRGVAVSANLFVKQNVFSTIGPFDSALISGEDIRFTARATQAGYRLKHSSEAWISHPGRSLSELIKKSFRVGIGKARAQNKTPIGNYAQIQNLNPAKLFQRMKNRQTVFGAVLFFQVYMSGVLAMAAAASGYLWGFSTSKVINR